MVGLLSRRFIGHTASFLAYLVLLIIVISGDSNVVPTRAEMVRKLGSQKQKRRLAKKVL